MNNSDEAISIPWTEGYGPWTFTLPPYGGSIERVGELRKYQRKTFHWQVSAPTQLGRVFVAEGKVKGTLEQAKQAVEKAIQQHKSE